MYTIVGLGNPGEKYIGTRHNAGFMALDAFAATYEFPEFKLDKQSNSQLSNGLVNEHKVILAKPQTMMNNSGRAVKTLALRYNIRDTLIGLHEKTQIEGRHLQSQAGLFVNPEDFLRRSRQTFGSRSTTYMVLVHDDIDLPLGKIKISIGSGSAGHKGVASVIQQLSTKDFARMRIGIQPDLGKPEEVEKFVLKPFAKDELPLLETVIKNTTEALKIILTQDVQSAMNQFNQ